MLDHIKKLAAVAFLLFMALWIAGTVRTLALDYPPPPPTPIVSLASERDLRLPANNSSNFASNIRQIPGLVETPLPLMLDKPEAEQIRIHEKRAVLTSSTTAFRSDEGLIRAAIKDQQADIFTEKNSGIEPGRRLTLEIGVHPEKFDALVDKLRTIASLSTITVEQNDRTSEFRTLHAKRQSIKKHHEAIVELRKGKYGSLEDALRLEGKIQEIERELQTLNAQFGDLLGKESYYHVHLTLVEHQPGDRRDHTFTLGQRVGHGCLWASAWWFGTALAAALVAATVVSVRVLLLR